jgi:CRISPR/Cas system-associated exonuclease Cas4 (RecB family)
MTFDVLRLIENSSDAMKNDHVIRASELGQYAYCARAWWLGSVEGVPSANVREMDAGKSMHEQHGQTVQLSAWLNRAGIICLALGLLMLALFVLAR